MDLHKYYKMARISLLTNSAMIYFHIIHPPAFPVLFPSAASALTFIIAYGSANGRHSIRSEPYPPAGSQELFPSYAVRYVLPLLRWQHFLLPYPCSGTSHHQTRSSAGNSCHRCRTGSVPSDPSDSARYSPPPASWGYIILPPQVIK